jgi:hypothetical protein
VKGYVLVSYNRNQDEKWQWLGPGWYQDVSGQFWMIYKIDETLW